MSFLKALSPIKAIFNTDGTPVTIRRYIYPHMIYQIQSKITIYQKMIIQQAKETTLRLHYRFLQ